MAGITIRDATETDADLVAGLLHAGFEEYRDRLDPPSGAHAETADHVREVMRAAGVGLARCDGIPAGCVFYEPDGEALHLSRLAVLPAYRRRGVGQALITFVESRGREMGMGHVTLAVRLALPHLRAWYERLGYHLLEMGTHPGYAQPTFVILEKEL